jgi:hypothetical protein
MVSLQLYTKILCHCILALLAPRAGCPGPTAAGAACRRRCLLPARRRDPPRSGPRRWRRPRTPRLPLSPAPWALSGPAPFWPGPLLRRRRRRAAAACGGCVQRHAPAAAACGGVRRRRGGVPERLNAAAYSGGVHRGRRRRAAAACRARTPGRFRWWQAGQVWDPGSSSCSGGGSGQAGSGRAGTRSN